MLWDEAEATIRAHIEEQWALSAYASIPLEFENENASNSSRYMLVDIQGVYGDKSIYGTEGYRRSIEAGLVFYHSFGPEGVGKAAILGPCVVMANILQLRVLAECISLDGANPPSPVQSGAYADDLVPNQQPEGQYYRCSGSVPFIVVGTI